MLASAFIDIGVAKGQGCFFRSLESINICSSRDLRAIIKCY